MSRLFATLLLSLPLALPVASSIPSEFSELDDAAEALAKKLASPVPHIVEVADFTTPDRSLSKQGQYVLLSFVPALQFHGQDSLLVKDHGEFIELLVREKIAQSDLTSPAVLKKLAALTGVDVLIVGTVERGPSAYTFRISAIHVPEGTILDTQSGQLPMADFLDSLDKPFPPKSNFAIEKPGANGVSFPACQYMPDPQYNDFARLLRIEGTIVIEALLSPEGRVVATHPLKLLGGGLDEESVRTLLQWRCKPAAKPDGTPVYAVVPVEFTFRVNFSKR